MALVLVRRREDAREVRKKVGEFNPTSKIQTIHFPEKVTQKVQQNNEPGGGGPGR